ncbi:hypothetical protein EW146_g2965 [Bondarzewia mesenterica]|uniref:Vacuole protein n=1 Tax=Bondarzewia mesenterica TaxID=1095465 RepID=A0A4V3XFL3_9AGAM|nr:hypothetical protein EW146_g2965 [Bondarzewia mesenterica]
MGSGPAWKREIVQDHKFDFVDTREFTDNGCGMRMKYLWLYIIVLKSFLVYVSDIFTAITMLTTSSWSSQINKNCPQTETNGCVFIPFSVGQWLFVGCIIFSFLLLAYEARKSKKIIASRDISYAFTNVMANNYYSLRSYDHFCFFDHISQSTKKKDDFAFFIFFTFKSWKRLLLADGPRQTINGLTLYAIYLAKRDEGPWYNLGKYFAGNTLIATALTISTLFTTIVFAGSLLLLIMAGIFYIPLLCYIQGNLKACCILLPTFYFWLMGRIIHHVQEYVCHKVDKRISEIIKRRNKQRLAKAAALARKEAAGDYSHLKNKKGELVHKPLPQPTLPNISLDEDDTDDRSSIRTREPAPSTYTRTGNDQFYAPDYKSAIDYPSIPAYNQPYSQRQDPNGHAHYNPSAPNLQDNMLYEDDYSSQAHLPLGAAPYAYDSEVALDNPHSAGLVHDPYDVYSGNTGDHHATQQHQPYSHPQQSADSSGLAYDDATQDYPSPTSGGPPPRSLTSTTYAQQNPYGHRSPSPGNGRYGYQGGGRGGGGYAL